MGEFMGENVVSFYVSDVVETTNISISFSCIKMLSASTGDVTEFKLVDTPVTVHNHN